MRPHGRAKVFRDCARFGFLNAKLHNLPLFHLFWVSFQFLCWFLGHLVCAKLLNGNINRAKKFAFRRSARDTGGVTRDTKDDTRDTGGDTRNTGQTLGTLGCH